MSKIEIKQQFRYVGLAQYENRTVPANAHLQYTCAQEQEFFFALNVSVWAIS